MEANEFKCAMCGNVYEKGRSDKEAYRECVDNFGKDMTNHSELDIVCDDCYQKIKPIEHPKELNDAINSWKEYWDYAMEEVKKTM